MEWNRMEIHKSVLSPSHLAKEVDNSTCKLLKVK